MKIILAIILLVALMFIPGCSSAINAELSLIEQSKRGLAAVDQSLKDREAIAQRQIDDRRAKLDAAFDADAAAQSGPLSTAWVSDARRAYGEAIDALADAKAKSQAAAEIDRQNLNAVNEALDELTTLNRAQLQWATFFKETK